MPTSYPGALDSFTVKLNDPGGDVVYAEHVNDLQDAISALEAKLGVNGSGDTTSIDYLLKNPVSQDPGHRHSVASLDSFEASNLAYSGLTSGHALMADSPTSADFRAIQETDIAPGGSIFAKVASNHVITGYWNLTNLAEFTLKNAGDPYVDLEYTHFGFGSDVILYWWAGATIGAGVPDVGLRRSNTATLRVTYADDAPGPNDIADLELGKLYFYEYGGNYYNSFITSASASSSYNYTLPVGGPVADYYLKTDALGNLSWAPASGGGVSPGGANTQVQFNDSGVFGGDSDLTWNKTTNVLTLAGDGTVDSPNVITGDLQVYTGAQQVLRTWPVGGRTELAPWPDTEQTAFTWGGLKVTYSFNPTGASLVYGRGIWSWTYIDNACAQSFTNPLDAVFADMWHRGTGAAQQLNAVRARADVESGATVVNLSAIRAEVNINSTTVTTASAIRIPAFTGAQAASAPWAILQEGPECSVFAGCARFGSLTAPERHVHVDEALRIQPQASPPASAALGDFYVDSDDSKAYFYNGSTWQAFTGAAGGPVPFNDLTDATNTNTLNNGTYSQYWNWGTLAALAYGLSLAAGGGADSSVLGITTTSSGIRGITIDCASGGGDPNTGLWVNMGTSTVAGYGIELESGNSAGSVAFRRVTINSLGSNLRLVVNNTAGSAVGTQTQHIRYYSEDTSHTETEMCRLSTVHDGDWDNAKFEIATRRLGGTTVLATFGNDIEFTRPLTKLHGLIAGSNWGTPSANDGNNNISLLDTSETKIRIGEQQVGAATPYQVTLSSDSYLGWQNSLDCDAGLTAVGFEYVSGGVLRLTDGQSGADYTAKLQLREIEFYDPTGPTTVIHKAIPTAGGSATYQWPTSAPAGTFLRNIAGGVLQWSLASQKKVTVVTTTSYLAQDTDEFIIADTASVGAAITINLPTASGRSGKMYYIKNRTTGSAPYYNCIIDAYLTEQIDGALTTTAAATWGFKTIICDGTRWLILSTS